MSELKLHIPTSLEELEHFEHFEYVPALPPRSPRRYLTDVDTVDIQEQQDSYAECQRFRPEVPPKDLIYVSRKTTIPFPSPVRPASPPSPVSPLSPVQDFWTIDEYLEHQSRGEVTQLVQKPTPVQKPARKQTTRPRRYSDQDRITREVRASLRKTPTPNHKSTASYPVYTSSTANLHTGYSSTPPFLPWGLDDMEHPRAYPHTQPASARSSFESRHKSPLSITTSIEYGYESSRTSQESSSSSSSSNASAKYEVKPPSMWTSGRKALVEPMVPNYPRYGAGGYGIQEVKGNKNNSMFAVDMHSRQSLKPSGEALKKLPEEILQVILGELKKSHLGSGSLSCATCMMRDLVNLGLSCKKWRGAAQIALYEDIILNGSDSLLQNKKKYKIKYATRLKLLRRTLRDQPDLAGYVKSLKVPLMPEGAKEKVEQDEYVDLVSSLIMVCPNLERLPGFYPAHNHTFTRFVYAMATRKHLKENVWIINPSPFQRQRRYNFSEDADGLISTLAPALLLPEQCSEFLAYHSNWASLKTLLFHCTPGGIIDSLLFTEVCRRLPSLENLHISSFPAWSFNDWTLTELPPLKSLRLDNLPGVTDAGLWSFASSPCSTTVTSLSLISLPLLSLPALARLFSRLSALTHFTISQAPSPCLPNGEEIFLHPYLASSTLEYLHWELTNPDDDKATEILTKSMLHGGFPALRKIRAPTDFDGSIQKLCKPREKIELPGDKYRNLGTLAHSIMLPSQSVPNIPSPARSSFSQGHNHSNSISSSFGKKSPTSSSFSLNSDHSLSSENRVSTREKGMSLVIARRMAQNRLEAAVNHPKFHVIIWDENGSFVERHQFGGYIGTVGSKVSYSLKPDIEGVDEAIVSVDGAGGLLDGGEEKIMRDGCTGSWNMSFASHGKNGRTSGGKERWRHTERGRWREVKLEKFF